MMDGLREGPMELLASSLNVRVVQQVHTNVRAKGSITKQIDNEKFQFKV